MDALLFWLVFMLIAALLGSASTTFGTDSRDGFTILDSFGSMGMAEHDHVEPASREHGGRLLFGGDVRVG